MFFTLATKSLLNRKGSVILALLAMMVSAFVMFSVEHVRHQVKDGFSSSVSGVDLIVGARTGGLNLLLYSVFRIGAPTNNISWETYRNITSHPQVKWAIPISLGDSHKGYRVMGTTKDYFEHMRYGNRHALELKKGEVFEHVFDVVLGADVARKLNYSLGDKLVLAHGISHTSFSLHDDMPFVVTGILAPTGTPIDQTLHVSLQGIEAIHFNWNRSAIAPDKNLTDKQLEQLSPKSITAFMIGLNSRMATFSVQQFINNFDKEPMTAILPGVALSELWQMMRALENTLRLVSILVFIAALFGLSAMLLSSIRDRSQEINLLRAIGAPSTFIFLLIQMEALAITLCSIVLGAGLLMLGLSVFQDLIVSNFGIRISPNIISINTLLFSMGILFSSCIISSIPSLSAYRHAKTLKN